MGTLAKPNDFSANTTISASQVNDNFDTIYNEFNGSIAAANLATDAVTTVKIADSNVTTAKLADSNVTTAKVADSAVTTAKIADDAVTSAKMQYGLVRHRQGGTSGDASWATSGGTNTETSAKGVFIQVGARNIGSGTAITYPVTFSQLPVVFASVNSASSQNVFVRITAQTASGCTLTCITDGGALATGELVHWMAIGQ